jgi:anti-anti-sigma factor
MDTRKVDDATIVAMLPRIDANNAASVQEGLADIIASGTATILCDFSATTYISSAGLRALLATAQQLQKSSGRLGLFAVRDLVKEVLDIAGFSKMLPVYASEDEALAAGP